MNITFIVGCARSGTSILGELVASHPEVKYFFEAPQIWELGGTGENESQRLVEKHATESVKSQIQEWFLTNAQGAARIVEKNPRNSLRIPYLKTIFPQAKFIHIVRDGRDVACSMVPGIGGREWLHLKPPSWQDFFAKYSGAVRCAYAWREVLEIALKDLALVPHIQIRYEDLLASPSTVAGEIFQFLDLDMHPKVLEFCTNIKNDTSFYYHAKSQDQWFRNDHKARIGRWQENLNNEEKETINALLFPLLTKLDYPTGNIAVESSTAIPELYKKNRKQDGKKLVVVLGMHRSGTSAITRGLQVMGANFGDNLLPAQADNPTGYWEDRNLDALNIEILESLGRIWHSISPLKPVEFNILRNGKYFLRAVELLREKMAGSELFAYKNPRLSILLPFWKEVFQHNQLDVKYILAIRHPLSVCKSLAVRDHFDYEKSYFLWAGHVISSLVGTRGEKTILVDYDLIMENPETELKRISKELGLEINQTEFENYRSEFLDENLRHTSYKLSDLDIAQNVPWLVPEIYSELLGMIKNLKTPEYLDQKTIAWSREFSHLDPALILSEKLTRNIESANEKILARDRQIAGLQQNLAEYQRLAAEREGAIIELSTHMAEKDEEIQLLAAQLGAKDGEIASLKDQLEEKDQPYLERSAELEEKQELIEDQTIQIETKDEIMQNLLDDLGKNEQKLQLLQKEISEIKNNKVWTASEPLRMLLEKYSSAKAKFIIRRSGLFDPQYYLKNYPDVSIEGMDPLDHFMSYGWREGRNPSAQFETGYYLLSNPDVAANGINPLLHYIQFGKAEGHQPVSNGIKND